MQKEFQKNTLHYLALGDSYTIGEGVKMVESYPFQLVTALNDNGLEFAWPTIIAKTGWTTKELQREIASAGIRGNKYDLVTLLIGVNNQYRGESIEIFKREFSVLLDQAISFAHNDPSRVVVISIPDWGVTPYAIEGKKDLQKIAQEIDDFNQTSQIIAGQQKVFYYDITQEYRRIGRNQQNVMADQLHPSGNIYQSWAMELKDLILSGMDFGDEDKFKP